MVFSKAESVVGNDKGCLSHVGVGLCTVNMYLGKEGSIEPGQFQGFSEANLSCLLAELMDPCSRKECFTSSLEKPLFQVPANILS